MGAEANAAVRWDRQVETDRPWNTKGNIGSSHIMRPVNLNASRLSSEQAQADD